ncbi:hypothetical protein MNBD_CHLOROFLEXI01-2054 [hydrothermal vent metagenome]|uniref:Uncharacterized protein n=1 Tax=hydrothermal vent metagenome TaxID=652676 RepID=A0A3B0UQJ5_9ZZZZ
MKNRENGRSPWLTGVVLLLAVVVLGAAIVLAAPQMPRLRDFDQTFYPAARYTLAGENPYTAVYIETDQGAPPDFFSPAWLLPILLPFSLLPQEIARTVWVLFLVGVTGAALLQMQAWGFKGLRPLLLIIFPWSLVGLLFGQVTPLVLLGSIWALNLVFLGHRVTQRSHREPQREKEKKSIKFAKSLIKNSQQSRWGHLFKLLLAFLLIGIKPQLGIFIAAPLLLEMAWRRDRRLIGLALFGGLLLGLTLLITPPWLISKAAEVQKITAPLWKSTLERELTLWRWPLWLAQPVRLLVVLAMARWAWLQRGTSPAWWAGWLTAVLILTPYTRAYDGVLLLPLLGLLLIHRRWQFGLFVIIMALYIQLPIGELGSVTASLAAWLLFIPWRGLIQGHIPTAFNAGWLPKLEKTITNNTN